MTLQIELTHEQELRLEAAARREGLAPEELAQRLVTGQLPPLPHDNGAEQALPARDPELCSRIQDIRGKYTSVGLSSQDLHFERRLDDRREQL